MNSFQLLLNVLNALVVGNGSYIVRPCGLDLHGPTAYKEINESVSFLNEAVHHKVCIQYQSKYNNLLSQILTLKNDIEYKIKHVMPRLLPNEKALVYGKETLVEHKRDKRAIPIGLIFSGVSAIGGLLIKGFNAISNYKKSTAMARAMKELYKAQEIDHK